MSYEGKNLETIALHAGWRAAATTGQLKETHKIREIRRSIAQLKTLNKEQEARENNDG